MLGLFFLTPIEIVAAFIGGVLSLFGIGAAGNQNRKPGGKRGPTKKGRKR
jgi:hypothetical protein